MALNGVSVVVAGAGLAGLAAARDLAAMGADVVVVDPRSRVGGRVWTIRDGFTDGQHAEAGGDLIDDEQHEIRSLARELGLELTRVLRGGFGYARLDASGRPRIVGAGAARGWTRLASALDGTIRRYRLAEQRWDSPIAADIAHRSVAAWLDEIEADDELRATALGLRGFFLADPQDLSLIALADQFASMGGTGPTGQMFRIKGGNDRLATTLAEHLGSRVRLRTEVVAVSQRGGQVRVSTKEGRAAAQIECQYVVMAVPATILRRIPIMPSLPPLQHEAVARLKYGHATKTLLQFADRFWRAAGRPRALGSPLPIGALWEGNEDQRGRPGILTLLAGGGASAGTQALMAKHGIAGLTHELQWLGAQKSRLIAWQQVVWETDPLARGGYAYFSPDYDPALRGWLARPSGRVFFAGEHTSLRWQGYMNGAIESGRRAAAEIAAVHG